MKIKRWLALGLTLLLFVGCQKTPVVIDPFENRLTVDELRSELSDVRATTFYDDVSVVYQIFPIAFADENRDNHGDLQGIISKLDYLSNDLGVDAIWMTPIHPSGTYHKYDVKDYKGIDPKFGTLEDFKELIREAHQRGIKIILDMVFNHTAYDHPWFQKALRKEEPYVNYYHLYDKLDPELFPNRNGWHNASGMFYYGGFWDRMPELDLDQQVVRDEIFDIMDFWIDLGVDGFRFDAAKHAYDPNELPKGTPLLDRNLQFWMELRKYVSDHHPETYLVSEIWDTAQNMSPYAHAYDSMFNFDFGLMVIDALNSGYHNQLITKHLSNVNRISSRNENFIDAPFLTNHDQNRIMTMLGNDINKAKLAASLLLTMPGIPFIYYGEELGMLGAKPDERIREPMRWNEDLSSEVAYWSQWQYNWETPTVEVQLQDETSLLQHYIQLIELRKSNPTLRFGEMEQLQFKNSSILAYERTDAQNRYLVVLNLYPGRLEGSFDEEVLANMDVLYQVGDYEIDRDKIYMSSQSMFVAKVQP